MGNHNIRVAPSLAASDLTVIIPVCNQLNYTRTCLETLRQDGIENGQIIVIDNGSTDGTADYLRMFPELKVITNPVNRGCGPAWNQGLQAATTEWLVVLNNDVYIPRGFFQGLRAFAIQGWDIVSPAMREGEWEYDVEAYAADFMQRMRSLHRPGVVHGVCFMLHRRVIQKIGLFGDYGGYEDHEYMARAREAGFRLGTTGGAFLHHFLSITQKALRGMTQEGKVNNHAERQEYRSRTGQTWLKRKQEKWLVWLRRCFWQWRELRQGGTTLRSQRRNGRIKHI